MPTLHREYYRSLVIIRLLESERSERDTLRSVQLRIGDILLLYTRKMVPIKGRASASFSSMLEL